MILPAENLSCEVMFIADLHLHPQQPEITAKFINFCTWAQTRTKKLYILGDFIHAWPGDDAIDAWSESIIKALAQLADSGVKVFFMPGNRDFLIGRKFLRQAKVKRLVDPSVLELNGLRVLLAHGDRYCSADKAHQRWRRLTQNPVFKLIFLRLPYNLRAKLVNKVRAYSASGHAKEGVNMRAIPEAMARHLRAYQARDIIHGHTHEPGKNIHQDGMGEFAQYILSDWDANPLIMCYNYTNKFFYTEFK